MNPLSRSVERHSSLDKPPPSGKVAFNVCAVCKMALLQAKRDISYACRILSTLESLKIFDVSILPYDIFYLSK